MSCAFLQRRRSRSDHYRTLVAEGVGVALMGAAEAWAREAGAGPVHLTTAPQREGAHRFYERLGYEGTGLRYRKALA